MPSRSTGRAPAGHDDRRDVAQDDVAEADLVERGARRHDDAVGSRQALAIVALGRIDPQAARGLVGEGDHGGAGVDHDRDPAAVDDGIGDEVALGVGVERHPAEAVEARRIGRWRRQRRGAHGDRRRASSGCFARRVKHGRQQPRRQAGRRDGKDRQDCGEGDDATEHALATVSIDRSG